jgi:dolichyl-diphosphooligosaccharide---protein glycosyltransferase
MRASLLFVLHSHGMYEGVYADPNRFREVFSSKYGKVRIFKVQS